MSSSDAARLAADGWAAPIRILCTRGGPWCPCGVSAWRSRREPTPARPALMRVRCEGCGRLTLIDPADPAAVLAELDGQTIAVEQAALF